MISKIYEKIKTQLLSIKLRTQLFIIFGLLIIVTSLSMGYVFYEKAYSIQFQQLQITIKSYSQLAALTVGNAENAKAKNIEPLLERLKAFAKIDLRIKAIYAMERSTKPGIWKFVFDVPIKNGVEPAEPGEEYDVSEYPQMRTAFDGPTVDNEVTLDKWGTWLSGYAPVYNAQKQATYVIGIDISAEEIQKQKTALVTILIYICIIFIILSLIVAQIFAINLTKPIYKIIEAAQKIGEGKYNYRISIALKNEIGFLAKTINSMAENIKRSFDKLSTLHRTANILTSTLEINQALTISLNLILEVTKSTKGVILLLSNDEKNIEMIRSDGIDGLLVKDTECIIGSKKISRRIEENVKKSIQEWLDFTDCNQHFILALNNKTKGIFFLDSEISDFEFLNTLMNQVALSIDNLQLLEIQKKQLKLEKELEVAHTVQASMLPDYDPDVTSLDVSGYSCPAAKIGGDYYDYFKISDTKFGLAVGDVNGHGITASLLMAMAKSCLFVQGQIDPNVIPVINALNRMVFGGTKERLFMTFIYSIFDIVNSTVTMSSAGHHLPYHFKKTTGQLEPINLKPVYPLGVRETLKLQEATIKIEPEDILVYYTDGIIEAKNIQEEEFGFERLEMLIKNNAKMSAKRLKDLMTRKYAEWIRGREMAEDIDDVTIVVVKVKPTFLDSSEEEEFDRLEAEEELKDAEDRQKKVKTGYLTLLGR